MLILTRKPGESIRIGDDIVIYVKSISGKTVRLGITAPSSIPVYREELLELEERPRRQAQTQPEVASGSFEAKPPAADSSAAKVPADKTPNSVVSEAE